MGEHIYIDVNYRGLSLGEGLQILEFTASQAYLHHPSPMPVGSELVLRAKSGVDFAARVSRVHEQVTGSDRVPGMMVTPLDLQGEALEWWDERVASAPEPEIEAADSGPVPIEAPAEQASDSHESDVHQPATESSEPANASRDTIVMDTVASQEPSSEQTSGKPAESRKNSDTIVMEAVSADAVSADAVSADAVSADAVSTEAVSADAVDPKASGAAEPKPAGKKNKKKRRSRRKNR